MLLIMSIVFYCLLFEHFYLLTWTDSSNEFFWSPGVRCLSDCPSVCKLFTFWRTSFPESLDQLQPTLAQCEDPVFSLWGGNGELVKIHSQNSSSATTNHFQSYLSQSILRWGEFNFFSNEGSHPSQRGDYNEILKIWLRLWNTFFQNHLVSCNQTWYKALFGEIDL